MTASVGKFGLDIDAVARRVARESMSAAFAIRWAFEARRAGKLLWRDGFDNIITNAGLDHILDIVLSGGTQITTWYIGLTDGTPTVAAGDTMSSHAGWAEVTAYDEAVRQTWSDGGVSSQSVDNSASQATYTIDTNSTTIGGGFLSSNSTKSGTTGVLLSAGAFSAGDKSLDDNDTVDVTLTVTAADS